MPWGAANWPSPRASTAAAAAGPELGHDVGGVHARALPPGRAVGVHARALRGGREARSRRDLVVDGLRRGLVGGDDEVQAQLGDVGEMGVVVGAQGARAHVDVSHDLLELLLVGEGVGLLVDELGGQPLTRVVPVRPHGEPVWDEAASSWLS